MIKNLKGRVLMLTFLPNTDYDFQAVLSYDESDGSDIDFYTNGAYDVRVRSFRWELLTVEVFPNNVNYNYLPTIQAFYDQDAGAWKCHITYQPYSIEGLEGEEQSNYLRDYMTCCGLGENACRTLTNLLNTIETNFATKLQTAMRDEFLQDALMDGILKANGEDAEGEWC